MTPNLLDTMDTFISITFWSMEQLHQLPLIGSQWSLQTYKVTLCPSEHRVFWHTTFYWTKYRNYLALERLLYEILRFHRLFSGKQANKRTNEQRNTKSHKLLVFIPFQTNKTIQWDGTIVVVAWTMVRYRIESYHQTITVWSTDFVYSRYVCVPNSYFFYMDPCFSQLTHRWHHLNVP